VEVRLVEKRTTSGKETMPSLFELALAYTKAGISIIPILPNEAMAPNGSDRTPFDCRKYIRHRIAIPEELREWFADDGQFGLAAVHGSISGGLECLDLTYAPVVKMRPAFFIEYDFLTSILKPCLKRVALLKCVFSSRIRPSLTLTARFTGNRKLTVRE
jgi:hypothetical protein